MTPRETSEWKIARLFLVAYALGLAVFLYGAHQGHSFHWVEKQEQSCMPMCGSAKSSGHEP